jgi:hypothetical protein
MNGLVEGHPLEELDESRDDLADAEALGERFREAALRLPEPLVLRFPEGLLLRRISWRKARSNTDGLEKSQHIPLGRGRRLVRSERTRDLRWLYLSGSTGCAGSPG